MMQCMNFPLVVQGLPLVVDGSASTTATDSDTNVTLKPIF